MTNELQRQQPPDLPSQARVIVIGGGIVGASVAYHRSRPRTWMGAGSYEIEVATEHVPATVSLRPLYDPANARIRD